MNRSTFFLFVAFILFQLGCSNTGEVSRFSLKMEGILVGQLDEIKAVYITEDDELLIPISERDGIGLVSFIGEDNSVELSLFLGDTWMGDYTLHRSPAYNSLRIPYEAKFDPILKAGGVKLKKH